jgi:hypothetical protein
MAAKSRLTRKSAKKVKTRAIRSRTKSRLSRKNASSAMRALRATQVFSELRTPFGTPLASAYYPGSEKPRYTKTKSGYKIGNKFLRPRVSMKGGFTRKQVSLKNYVSKTGSVGIGALKKNKLGQFGYHTTSSQPMRHKSLDKAVKKFGDLSVYRSLNAIAVYNKNTHPETADVARSDRDYIKAKYFE